METQHTTECVTTLQKRLRILALVFLGLSLLFFIFALTLPFFKLHPMVSYYLLGTDDGSISFLRTLTNVSDLYDGEESLILFIVYFAAIIIPLLIAIAPLVSLSCTKFNDINAFTSKSLYRKTKALTILYTTAVIITILISIVYRILSNEEVEVFYMCIASFNLFPVILMVGILIALIVLRRIMVITKENLLDELSKTND